MALNSAEFPFLIPALAVSWQNSFMPVSMVQFGQYGKLAGIETRISLGAFKSSSRKQ
jgi:GH25 family lysozyme M1 (1,4-beta-N-acetylmuramidase)